MIRFFFWLVTPIQRLMQKIGKPETKITEGQVHAIMSIADEGMALFSYETLRITSFFIKGIWKHAAIIAIDDFGKFWVVEAVGKGVQKVPIEEWLYKKDAVMLADRLGFDRKKRSDSSIWSFAQIGKEYDYEFSKDDKDFYCSELTADALDIPVKGIIEPTELANMSEYLKPLYDTTRSGHV